jgi:prepilin peptidase CpaA
MLHATLFMLVGALMLVAAAYDVLTLTIPNWISLALLALFPLLAFVAGLGWQELGWHALIFAVALAAGVGAFAAGVVGGGDAKLFAAVSLYMGPIAVAPYVFYVAIAGGVLAMVFLVLHRPSFAHWARRSSVLAQIVERGMAIPYGVAIVAGGLIAFPASHLFLVVAPT